MPPPRKGQRDDAACLWRNLWNLPVTTFRFFTVYGPWGRARHGPVQIRQGDSRGYADRRLWRGADEAVTSLMSMIFVEAIIRLIDTPPVPGLPAEGVADSLSPAAPLVVSSISGAVSRSACCPSSKPSRRNSASRPSATCCRCRRATCAKPSPLPNSSKPSQAIVRHLCRTGCQGLRGLVSRLLCSGMTGREDKRNLPAMLAIDGGNPRGNSTGQDCATLLPGSAKVKRGVNRIPVRKKELFFYLKLLLIKKHFRDAEIYKIYHVCPDIGLPAASGVAPLSCNCHSKPLSTPSSNT